MKETTCINSNYMQKLIHTVQMGEHIEIKQTGIKSIKIIGQFYLTLNCPPERHIPIFCVILIENHLIGRVINKLRH